MMERCASSVAEFFNMQLGQNPIELFTWLPTMLQLFCTRGKRRTQKVHYFSFPCGESCQFSTSNTSPRIGLYPPPKRNTNTRTISPHFPLSAPGKIPPLSNFSIILAHTERGRGGTVADISNVAHAPSLQYQYVISEERLLVMEELVPYLLVMFVSLFQDLSSLVLKYSSLNYG